MKIPALVMIALLLTGCGGAERATLSPPTPTASPTPARTNTPTPPSTPGVHFASPEAAMRYLASAWNRKDLTELRHVTDPTARKLLVNMYSEATDLKLNKCTLTRDRGDYECFFTHGFPKGYHSEGPIGTAEFTVGPAKRPGWYMTYFVDCGG